MTPAIEPSGSTWTLRFKHNRSTVVLHVDPLQSFSSIRNELLKAIQQTHPSGTLNNHTIPSDADDILLARPVDINDLSLGWETLEQDDNDGLFDETNRGKGKGKAVVGRGKGKENPTSCPKVAGLRDGGMVAFKFKSESVGEVEEEDRLDDDTLVRGSRDEKWDVVLACAEDEFDGCHAEVGDT
ncbi:Hypothetical protein R9X50_00462200 [Acrodontium crateriforme]|uniref:Uncharacterized protein n=1 Tax=Acrodontium crateriforme TaxID=150365 RepID=A0AAQ3RAX8_9PEZI|nr:Hypothetical protein R9X50_00462200 [Acrodontium crateriforme]